MGFKCLLVLKLLVLFGWGWFLQCFWDKRLDSRGFNVVGGRWGPLGFESLVFSLMGVLLSSGVHV